MLRSILLEVNFASIFFYFPWFVFVLSSNFRSFTIHFSDKRHCPVGQDRITNQMNCSRSLHGKKEVSFFKKKKKSKGIL